MATAFQIPRTEQQAKDAGRLIIRSFGLQFLKTELYKQGMPVASEKDQPLYKSSMLGTPVFSDLSIQETSYRSGDRILTTPAISFETVLFNVMQRKNIVVTPVQGRNGTVKEYISDGDYQISIRGVITGPNGKYPKDEEIQSVKTLFQKLIAPIALDVDSWFLAQFGIYSIVVSDFSFPQFEGVQSSQAFEIQAISDIPLDLQVIGA